MGMGLTEREGYWTGGKGVVNQLVGVGGCWCGSWLGVVSRCAEWVRGVFCLFLYSFSSSAVRVNIFRVDLLVPAVSPVSPLLSGIVVHISSQMFVWVVFHDIGSITGGHRSWYYY